jgi:hypothetical protein
MSPANFIWTNPEISEATITQGGRNLVQGLQNFIEDWQRATSNRPPLGAEEFVPADHVQIAGVSYKTITETGLELRRRFGEKYRFRSPHVTINPAGMDMEDWSAQGVPEEFAVKQVEVIEIYRRMGAVPTLTCTPYLLGAMPPSNSDAFLSESSVVAYANSVLGVRTNRESGLSTLLYAIAGVGPRYGLHLASHRTPRVGSRSRNGLAMKQDRARTGLKKTEQQANRGGLSRAVGTEETADATGGHMEVEGIDRGTRTEASR